MYSQPIANCQIDIFDHRIIDCPFRSLAATKDWQFAAHLYHSISPLDVIHHKENHLNTFTEISARWAGSNRCSHLWGVI